MSVCDVAVIGAGPYGLSAAAHLKAADGLDIRVFGEPMSFWERHMPKGMLLRSPLEGSHLSDPSGALSLEAYAAARGNPLTAPLPLPRFTDYGRWFQNQAVPDLDSRRIHHVEKNGSGFHLTLEGGENLKARRVVIAAGIMPFAWHPLEFRSLPRYLASHASAHTDLSRFSGKQVAVIGGGQSALESGALLHEVGAEVEVLVRTPIVRWLWRRPWVHTCRPIARMLYAPPDVGQAGISHLSSATFGDRVILKLADGSERRVDHVLLATGYRVDISRYPFLGAQLLSSIRQIGGYPQLEVGFESSVPGLHFLGAPAAWSFGPLLRFVAGADFAARELTGKIFRKAPNHGDS